jgi:tetratricopeptide (TPR) repeat protein
MNTNIHPGTGIMPLAALTPPQQEPKALQRWWVRQQVRWFNLLGQPQKTLAVHQHALQSWPLWGDGAEGLAFALAQNGRLNEAASLLHSLVQREPLRGQAWFNLGFLLQQLEAQTSPNTVGITAENALRQATVLSPGNDRAWYGLALELIAQGRHQDAVPCLKTCTQLQPMSPYAWYQLGRTYASLGQFQKAREVLEQLKTFDPKVSGQLQRELAASQLRT